MPTRGRHILFVGHDASRSGAPAILLHLLRWLRANTDLSARVLLLDGGPLESAFAELAPTVSARGPQLRMWRGVRRVLARVGLASLGRAIYRNRLWAAVGGRPGLLYLNSVATGGLLVDAGPAGCPVVCHVHELAFALSQTTDAATLAALLRDADRFVACADAVGRTLRGDHGVPADRVRTIHEFIPVPPTPPDRAAARRLLAADVELADDALVVGMTGVVCWRKGADLFIQVARLLYLKHRPAG